ncbi:trehalose-phosphatase [Aquibium sp. A9E412]|uniref:trehalose-phosphatase n=1 Tax=Aquibium sp. A9E412 TaxID=2976767 RepID=UPI0025B1B03E|nr:trehalose-phosphatase [Aquibium sp. A9E412]MDN2567556.1 trehalose-phosphatase [Aquibium sp. A9E412]
MSGPVPLLSYDDPRLVPGRVALFLDFDGTLAEITERPDAVRVDAETRAMLARLERATGGALAIVTGRAIGDIDGFLAPLRLAVAGVHGLERRTADGARLGAAIDEAAAARVRASLEAAAAEMPGTLVEAKPGSLALHYRQAPERAEAAIAAAHAAVEGLEGVHVLNGKMVVEVKLGSATKADAVAQFMDEPPFAGRLPVVCGDDVTDEDAFREAAARGGVTVKIGPGETVAGLRAAGPAELRRWLVALADSFEPEKAETA